jgi:hypothetical protein
MNQPFTKQKRKMVSNPYETIAYAPDENDLHAHVFLNENTLNQKLKAKNRK